MTMIRKDLGTVTAYAYAVSKGYTGTEAEFAELMASYANVAEEAAQSASDAENAAARAEQAAATLTVDDALSDTSTNPVQNKVVTAEFTNVKSAFSINAYDKLSLFAVNNTKTAGGVTLTWVQSERKVYITGTATEYVVLNMYNNETVLPQELVPGSTYKLVWSREKTGCGFKYKFFGSEETYDETEVPGSGIITVPSDAIGFRLRAVVNNGFAGPSVMTVSMPSDITNHELHDAIRTITDRMIYPYNAYDILQRSGSFTDKTMNGVTFTWNAEHTQCTANGTADGGRAYVNIYNNSSAIPDGINPGSKYNVTFTTTDVYFALVFGLYDTLGTFIEDKAFRSDGVLKIPDNCGGMYIRLIVYNGRTVTNAVASNIALVNTATNYQLSQDVAQIQQIYGIKTGYDVLTRYGNFTDRTFRGITFTWSGRQCHVSGTADGGEAYVNIYYGSLPDGMLPGDLYSIRYESTTSRIGIHCYFYDESETLISNVTASSDMGMIVPVGASKWLIRIYVVNGATLDGYLTRLQVVKVKPLEMDVPLIVSFVDDDTTTDELVTKFHDACCHNGVKGNYAVITKSVENGNTSASRLVAYEDEGFGLLIHCYQQYYPSDSPWNPEGGVRTEAQTNACRANLAKGIRQMIDMGLLNYEYWITPGGHREQDLVDVAKQLSLKCLISTNNGRENNMTDYNKWFIKRVSFGATDTPASSSMSGIKALIDEVASRGKGWFIITTHFNDGWSDLTWDDTLDANGYPIGYARFNEMVQYAISKGMVPMSIPQAWQYYAPILEANRNECNQANAT